MANFDNHAAEIKRINKRVMLGFSFTLFVCVVFFMGMLTFGVYQFRENMTYPGATLLSNHQLSRFPSVLYQQRLSLRSVDRRPDIYRWYVRNTGVGLEEAAEGQCSHMSGSDSFLLFDLHTSLTLCDAAQNRTIYIQRSLHLNWK